MVEVQTNHSLDPLKEAQVLKIGEGGLELVKHHLALGLVYVQGMVNHLLTIEGKEVMEWEDALS